MSVNKTLGNIKLKMASVNNTECKKEENIRAEEELVRLRKAIETSSEVIFLTDRDGIFTFVNPEFVRVYGYNPNELIGKATPRVLKSGELKPEQYKLFWDSLLSKQVVKGELVNKTKDGRLLPVESSANSILDVDGNISGFLAVQRDITDRKKAEEALKQSEENFRNSIDNYPLGISIVAIEGGTTPIYANKKLLEIYGFASREEFSATSPDRRFTPESYSDYLDRMRRVRLGENIPKLY